MQIKNNKGRQLFGLSVRFCNPEEKDDHLQIPLYLILPLQGRARFDTVARGESFGPRTPQLACTGYPESLLGSTLGRPSGPGGNHLDMYETIKYGRGAGAAAAG
eukprot:409356-Pleurochrysis_carterae.AAC.1